jgi:hypothetical protein
LTTSRLRARVRLLTESSKGLAIRHLAAHGRSRAHTVLESHRSSYSQLRYWLAVGIDCTRR